MFRLDPAARAATLLLSAVILLSGCAAHRSAPALPDYTPSGFLEDYSLLEPGKKGQASLIYRNPDVDIPAYKKILIDRVTIWRGTERDANPVDHDDFVRMANLLYTTFRSRLEETHVITDAPGPETLRFRLALTDVGADSKELIVYSTVVPLPEQVDDASQLSDAVREFFANANVEAEVTDSQSDQLLMEAVTQQVGGRALDGSIETWDEANQVFEHWADTLATRARAGRKQ